jgi:hypothetical protein
MKEISVVIPEETITVIEFRQEQYRGLAETNTALRDFKSKEVFAWHLSLLCEIRDADKEGLLSSHGEEAINKLKAQFDKDFRGPDLTKPNALFLAIIEWNATVELIWRVYDPEPIYSYLNRLLASKNYAYPFDFRIDNDPSWKLAEWHLK